MKTQRRVLGQTTVLPWVWARTGLLGDENCEEPEVEDKGGVIPRHDQLTSRSNPPPPGTSLSRMVWSSF